MPESTLTREHAAERAEAVRVLLRSPMLDRDRYPGDFALVARQRDWLATYFEDSCGWDLTVDLARGYARLEKRSATPDASRPARRSRGDKAAFDRRRYELLCLVCADLTSHPVTTIGLVAANVAAASADSPAGRFDTAKRKERAAFVDALKLLADWGVVRFESGDVDAFVASDTGNALVSTDAPRLHRLIASATAPSRIDAVDAVTTDDAVDALRAEPRYDRADDDEARLRGTRHRLCRRVLDDPAVYRSDLPDDEAAYLDNPAGRRWLRERVQAAGLLLEERAEGLVAVDADAIATDVVFPAPSDNVKQMALVLVDTFVGRASVSMAEATARVEQLLAAHPSWARDFRDDTGAGRLARAAVRLLADLRLVDCDGDVVVPRPALARYALPRELDLFAAASEGSEGGER